MFKTKNIKMFVTILLFAFTILSCKSETKKTENQKETVRENAYTLERPEVVESSGEADEILKEGNDRFVENKPAIKETKQKRVKLASGQKPFAVIITCSDSRVPPELIFDQGLGDLFVVRIAGNVVGEIEIGSVEYAVEHLKAPLVVVMGHEKCGAVQATVDNEDLPGDIPDIAQEIQPAVSRAKVTGESGDDLVDVAVEENVKESMNALRQSTVLKEKLGANELVISGAKYELASGRVEWLNANGEFVVEE